MSRLTISMTLFYPPCAIALLALATMVQPSPAQKPQQKPSEKTTPTPNITPRFFPSLEATKWQISLNNKPEYDGKIIRELRGDPPTFWLVESQSYPITVKDNIIAWKQDAIEFTGTISPDGESMSGTYGKNPSIPWSAKQIIRPPLTNSSWLIKVQAPRGWIDQPIYNLYIGTDKFWTCRGSKYPVTINNNIITWSELSTKWKGKISKDGKTMEGNFYFEDTYESRPWHATLQSTEPR